MFIFSSIKTPKIQYIIISDDGQFHTKLITNSDNVIHYFDKIHHAFLQSIRCYYLTLKIKSCSIETCTVGNIQLQMVHKKMKIVIAMIASLFTEGATQHSSSTVAQNKRYF